MGFVESIPTWRETMAADPSLAVINPAAAQFLASVGAQQTQHASLASSVSLVRCDITSLSSNSGLKAAIVNAANSRMLGGGGVDGRVHARAGKGLLQECLALPLLAPGKVGYSTI